MLSKFYTFTMCAALFVSLVFCVENQKLEEEVELNDVEMLEDVNLVDLDDELDFDALVAMEEDEMEDFLFDEEMDLEAMMAKEISDSFDDEFDQNFRKKQALTATIE